MTESRLRSIIREEAQRVDESGFRTDVETLDRKMTGASVTRIYADALGAEEVTIEFDNGIAVSISGDNLDIRATRV